MLHIGCNGSNQGDYSNVICINCYENYQSLFVIDAGKWFVV
jgi:hypothetical protein